MFCKWRMYQVWTHGCLLQDLIVLEDLAGWSELAVYQGLETFSKIMGTLWLPPSPAMIPTLYLTLSGECPWTQATELIWKLFLGMIIDLYLAWHLAQIPDKSLHATEMITHTCTRILTIGSCHLIQIRVSHQCTQGYAFLILCYKVYLIHWSMSAGELSSFYL